MRPANQPFKLKEGAWFIADAHYSRHNRRLYDFLASIPDGSLPPQLVLMGDIFDLLFGEAPNSIGPNRAMVDLLRDVAGRVETVYLEGNHDFGLAPIFGDVMRIVPRDHQPLMADFSGVAMALHHGDTYEGVGYELYTALIRNRWIDRMLNVIDSWTDGMVIQWLERYNASKKPCFRVPDFESMACNRVEKLRKRYRFSIWVEGHYHQQATFWYDNVMHSNLPAFVCTEGYVELVWEDAEPCLKLRDAKEGSKVAGTVLSL